MRSTLRYAEDATLVREAAGTRNADGKFMPGAVIEESIKVLSAPYASSGGDSSEARTPMRQGARHRERRVFWLTMDARSLRRGESRTDSDFIRYGGQMYRVTQVDDWQPHGVVQATGVVPDAGDDSAPDADPQTFAAAPIIFPLDALGDICRAPALCRYRFERIEITSQEVTTIDTELPRAQIAGYHTLAMAATFPTFLQLVSVDYLLHNDGLDLPIGITTVAGRSTLHIELHDTLVLRFDLTQHEYADDHIDFFSIRGIG